MESKNKAEELVKKYFDLLTFKSDYKNVKDTNSRAYPIFRTMSIECAMVCVEEMIQLLIILERNSTFYEKVKTELEKME
ncbi:hypothetical protein M2T79_02540 [Elizabethkingia miricola]|uniref:hypothetical protein n=1 Tax=Elizabethkingia miricola TaxID=172045 RepID=UPI002019DE0E|nr:hypothetical protein [Elizabethkingia miricola]MCL1655459.1 hypothetical protein [Elizabethkingia miricola]